MSQACNLCVKIIISPPSLAVLVNFSFARQARQQFCCLIFRQVTQLHHIRALYLAVALNELEYHLLLLNGIKPRLTHVGRFSTALLVDSGTQGIATASASAMSFNQANL